MLLLMDEGDIEEMLLLDYIGMPKLSGPRFNLDALDDGACYEMFRFRKQDIIRLKEALLIQNTIVTDNKSVFSGVEALCILLRRLAYPNRLGDLVPIFGRCKEDLSRIFNLMLSYIYDHHGHLLSNLNKPWLSRNHLQMYADAVTEKGGPLQNCWGFIDGTARPVCRPTYNQRECYSGHKRVHCLKYQSVQVPNGLIAHMFGPVEGRRHDAAMLAQSGLLNQLAGLDNGDDGPFCLYGDPAYPLRVNLISPYRGANLSVEQMAFNKAMSKVRQCVEWSFGGIVQEFAFLDYKKNMKIYLQPVGKCYLVGSLLWNCRTCLYGNQTSEYFGIQPPSLEDYLQN